MAGSSPVLASPSPSGWAGLGWTFSLARPGRTNHPIFHCSCGPEHRPLSWIQKGIATLSLQDSLWKARWSGHSPPHAPLFPPLCQFSCVLPDSFILQPPDNKKCQRKDQGKKWTKVERGRVANCFSVINLFTLSEMCFSSLKLF